MDYDKILNAMVAGGVALVDAKGFVQEMRDKAGLIAFSANLRDGISTPFGTLKGEPYDYVHITDAETGAKVAKKGFRYGIHGHDGKVIASGTCGSTTREAAAKWLQNRVRTLCGEGERLMRGNVRNDGTEQDKE